MTLQKETRCCNHQIKGWLPTWQKQQIPGKPRDSLRVTNASASSWVMEESWYETDGPLEAEGKDYSPLVYSQICFPHSSQGTLAKMQIQPQLCLKVLITPSCFSHSLPLPQPAGSNARPSVCFCNFSHPGLTFILATQSSQARCSSYSCTHQAEPTCQGFPHAFP